MGWNAVDVWTFSHKLSPCTSAHMHTHTNTHTLLWWALCKGWFTNLMGFTRPSQHPFSITFQHLYIITLLHFLCKRSHILHELHKPAYCSYKSSVTDSVHIFIHLFPPFFLICGWLSLEWKPVCHANLHKHCGEKQILTKWSWEIQDTHH